MRKIMADLIQIQSTNPYIFDITQVDGYGGKTYLISASDDLQEMLIWYNKYKDQMIKESKARERFESVAIAYEQYQMTLKLVLDQI